MTEPTPSQPEGASAVRPHAGTSLLSQFVAAVLCDVARAQHLSNRYTTKLAGIYRDHELLSALSIPNGRFRELEIDAHLGINAPLHDHPDENDYQLAVVGGLNAAMPLIAGEALGLFAGILRDGPEQHRDLADAVERAPMHDYTARGTLERLLLHDGAFFDSVTGQFERERLADLLQQALFATLQGHRELRAALDQRSLADGWRHAVAAQLERWVDLIVSGAESLRRLAGEPGLAVQTETASLMALTPGLAANLKLRVELRDYRWVVNVQTDPSGVTVKASRLVPDDR